MTTKHTLIVKDVFEGLNTLEDKSVHMVKTSPPYYNQRDYGVDGQIGLESTPEEYVQKLVDVFREVRRVLRDDGVVWLNLGDSYYNYRPGKGQALNKQSFSKTKQDLPDECARRGNRLDGLKEKDIIGIPWMVAFALRADGWYLRQDIIWEKPNCMPESVKDRCTKSHEYVFLLTKKQNYYFDHIALREPAAYDGRKDEMMKGAVKSYDGVLPKGKPQTFASRGHARWLKDENGVRVRNRRSVWKISTSNFTGAHFATFPEKLVEPCIIAGTSEFGCCSVCGAPHKRKIVEGEPIEDWKRSCGSDSKGGYNGKAVTDYTSANAQNASEVKARILAGMVEKKTVGWSPTCKCSAEVVPCVVLDPFAGTGTVAKVARDLGRSSISIELNPEYVQHYNTRMGIGTTLDVGYQEYVVVQ